MGLYGAVLCVWVCMMLCVWDEVYDAVCMVWVCGAVCTMCV